jgi:phytoene dehydrogenase-like protein
MNAIAERLGEVGLPAPISELAARDWDAVIVGGGHNGLTCAAYLARAGQSVLVLERRERLGGACTLERPFADSDYVVSPCAYVVGLLDELVIGELGLKRRGLQVHLADPNHRGAHRAHRRQHLPGRDDARPDVGAPAARADAAPGALSLRRGDASGRQRDRAQRPQRGDGGARGRSPARSARVTP